MIETIQLRRDTAGNWASANPVLADGEEGHETDTGKRKVGDGVTAWASLGYWSPGAAAGVASFNSRTGTVAPQPGDYAAYYDASGAASAAQGNAEAYAASAAAAEASRAGTAEALLAPKASPVFTGTVTVPAAVGATDAAQKQYVDGAAGTAQANAEAASLPSTDDLSAIATANATAASVPMNSHKFTGLAAGSAPGDSAAYGQTPAGGSTVTIGQGGTGQATQQAAVNALTGTQSAGKYLRSDGANATLQPITAADLPAATTSAQGAVELDGTASDIQPVAAAAAAGATGQAADAGHAHKGFARLATTGTAGFALQNGTPNILTWTAPGDSAVHMFVALSVVHVTSAETGGTVQVIFQSPISGAGNHFSQLVAGGLGTDANGQTGTTIFGLVQPGTTVTIQQTTALTAGAATAWFEIWGS